MLYFRALLSGLSALPAANAELRVALQAELDALGSATLHARLAQQDPLAASKIHSNDPQRILRALEVITLTGEALSAQQTSGLRPVSPPGCLRLGIFPADRALLHGRIAERFDAMLDAGLVDEVRRLRQRPGLTSMHPSMRSVGYRQIWEGLEQHQSLSEMREKGIAATRQLAKRQLTWMRSDPTLIRLDGSAEALLAAALAQVHRHEAAGVSTGSID
jgi:tRNA dimethylallyltransferase